jgi:hypothetical protein
MTNEDIKFVSARMKVIDNLERVANEVIRDLPVHGLEGHHHHRYFLYYVQVNFQFL